MWGAVGSKPISIPKRETELHRDDFDTRRLYLGT